MFAWEFPKIIPAMTHVRHSFICKVQWPQRGFSDIIKCFMKYDSFDRLFLLWSIYTAVNLFSTVST